MILKCTLVFYSGKWPFSMIMKRITCPNSTCSRLIDSIMIRNSIILEKTVMEGQILRIVADSHRAARLSTLSISKTKIILNPCQNLKET
jgi:hypothetical protein